MELQYIYPRMFGYAATIVLHTVNTVSMMVNLHTEQAQKLFQDPAIRFFYENQARYFTCWTFFLQVVYAVIGLSCDCLTLKNSYKRDYKLPKYLKSTRDILFSGIQWPATLMVTTVFWGIFNLDRELVLPKVLDQVLSRTSNHIIHTCITPVVLWELVFRPRLPPRSHLRNLFHLTLHYVAYFSVLFYTYFETGGWIYPIFKQTAGTIYFPIFMLFVYLLLVLYYFIQWPLTSLVHGDVEYKEKSR